MPRPAKLAAPQIALIDDWFARYPRRPKFAKVLAGRLQVSINTLLAARDRRGAYREVPRGASVSA